jgi:restriction alleviation protein Lar
MTDEECGCSCHDDGCIECLSCEKVHEMDEADRMAQRQVRREGLEMPEQPANGVDVPELKPCPFCGSSEPRLVGRSQGEYWQVICDDQADECGATISHDTRTQVISAWNTRTAERELAIAKRALVILTGPEGCPTNRANKR